MILSELAARSKVAQASETVRDIALILVFVILRLASAAWHLVYVHRVDPLSKQAGTVPWLSGIRMCSLAYVALLSGLRASTRRFVHAGCHIRAIAQLALFVLVIGIISGVGSACKVVIVADDVVVRASHSIGQPLEIVHTLVLHTTSHSKPLRTNFGRIESTVVDSILCLASHSTSLLLHALVNLLLSIDTELTRLATDEIVRGRSRARS